MGYLEEADAVREKADTARRNPTFLQRRLENEINALYDRLAKGLKEENARLRAELEQLKGKQGSDEQ